ncbi:MAG: hypothetical protein QW520_07605 [Methanomassiliicoccales archaeon]
MGEMKNKPELNRKKSQRSKKIRIFIYVIIIIIGAILLLPEGWYLWVLILAVALFRIYSIAYPRTAFKCNKCGQVFMMRGKKGYNSIKMAFKVRPEDLYKADEIKCPNCGSTNYQKIKHKLDK